METPMADPNAIDQQRTTSGRDATLPDLIRSLRAQEESANRSSAALWLVLFIINLGGGILWAVAEQGASGRSYVGGVLPVSWLLIGSGILGITIFSFLAQQKTAATPDVSVSMDGIKTRNDIIRWEEIDRVYVGGTTIRSNIRISKTSATSDRRFIKVFSKDGRQADFVVNFDCKMNETASQTFGAIRAAILARVWRRQWDEFIGQMQSGNPVQFSDSLVLRGDGIISANFDKGKELLPFKSICGISLKDGEIYLDYRNEKGKQKATSLGGVGTTANIHILQAFLDHVVQVNQGKGSADGTRS
jgi:hypothetical protein